MVALWGAMKSVLKPNDTCLCISNGIFGDGFPSMAKASGAKVVFVQFPYDEPFDMTRIKEEFDKVQEPIKLVTAVHCETPSGALNRNIHEIGTFCKEKDALFMVDFVASAFGTDVRVEDWNIDLGLLGSQKVLSLPPDLGVMTVSEKAWEVMEQVGYEGYDAVLPFKNAVQEKRMPYSHNWRALHAMNEVLKNMDLEASFARHTQAAEYTRKRVREMGLSLFCPEEIASPTVTSVKVPEKWDWKEFDAMLRERGIVFGGSYGSLAGKVFRIGHMGRIQTDMEYVKDALDGLEEVIKEKS